MPPKREDDAATRLSAAGIVSKTVRFAKAQKIFQQGDPADYVFLIQQGVVKITIVNEQGKEAVIALLEAGDFVGESCISNGSPLRITSASAAEPTNTLMVE
ncbi:MAG: cyclic nucleotide-binding domain-containing protein, partial [Candidatus Acidiferrum sp.]